MKQPVPRQRIKKRMIKRIDSGKGEIREASVSNAAMHLLMRQKEERQ